MNSKDNKIPHFIKQVNSNLSKEGKIKAYELVLTRINPPPKPPIKNGEEDRQDIFYMSTYSDWYIGIRKKAESYANSTIKTAVNPPPVDSGGKES